MPTLLETLRSQVQGENQVESAVFGTDDPDAIGASLEDLCGVLFGCRTDSCLFYGSSTGCVVGLELVDGRRVVVKAYQDRWGEGFLASVGSVQRHLFRSGFPCPEPLGPVTRIGPALATVEAFVPDPGTRPLKSPADMNASAAGLARLVTLSRPVSAPGLSRHPLNAASQGLYPQPHSPIFDFSLDAEGAAWIDDLARAANEARDTEHRPNVIGHTDWSARNIRIGRGRLLVAYDWDSLTLTTESVIAGQAAATWRSFGETAGALAPGPTEVRRYVSAYETASGRPFDQFERRSAMAAALWVLAYSARCEHALEASTGLRVRHARGRLRRDGAAFLNPASSA